MLKPLLSALLVCMAVSAAPTIIKEWRFEKPEDFQGWHTHHVANQRVENGSLHGEVVDWDGQLSSPEFSPVPAMPWQYVEIKLKTTFSGQGELFYTNTMDTPYGGFKPKSSAEVTFIGDNQWHVLRIQPCWQLEKNIIRIRLDFPTMKNLEPPRPFAVEYIRIMDEGYVPAAMATAAWTFPLDVKDWSPCQERKPEPTAAGLKLQGTDAIALNSKYVNADDNGYWLHLEMSATAGNQLALNWTSSMKNGYAKMTHPIIADGRPHHYNINLSSGTSWFDNIYLLRLQPSNDGNAVCIVKSISIQDEPSGPPEIIIVRAGQSDAINRAGQPSNFQLSLTNYGGSVNQDTRITRLELPKGVSLVAGALPELPKIEPFESAFVNIGIQSAQPLTGDFLVEVTTPGKAPESYRGTLSFTPALNLPKADYVPQPQPVDTGDYDVGALYFPGWNNTANGGWPRIWQTCPERKPMLGWYDEGNPECVDWHIKWLVENGIKYLFVDWYWNRGQQHLDHWIKAYKQCRYRGYIRWAVMWANHNGAGSHSEKDQRAVVKWWIDNYFNMPEYYRIDGKPLVMMWYAEGQESDMKDKGGVKRLNDISQEMAKAAGYPGIHFSVIKRPEHEVNPDKLQWFKDNGFESTSLYRYRHHGGLSKNETRFPFQYVANTSLDLWQRRAAADILPFYINITSGWDDRPWRNTLEIYGRTPELFKKICEDAKQFADRTHREKWLLLGPVNEWGEGSYIEPNKEFGFKMYEAVRDTFAKKPATGWPLNYAPSDVGLGPYDLPLPQEDPTLKLKDWTFDSQETSWKRTSGAIFQKFENGCLCFTTASRDPIVSTSTMPFKAQDYKKLVVRMKVSPQDGGEQDNAQLFWETKTAPISETLSIKVPYTADNTFQDIVFDLTSNKRWQGKISGLRFDPLSREGAKIEIDRIWLE